MKAIFKLLLVLTFCFAALCQRNVAFQVDSISVAVRDNYAPYFMVMQGGSTYYIALESIYEIYQDPSTSQWLKDFATETTFQSLQWSMSVGLVSQTISLLGAPCPCQNSQQAQDVEPFPVTSQSGLQRQIDLSNLNCMPVNFDWIQLLFQENTMGNTNCTGLTDISTCTNNCNQVCANATNPTTCNTGCSAITNATSIDTNDCLNACNNDTDCLNACTSVVDCVLSSSCPLYLNYQLRNYQWANSNGNSNGTGNNSGNGTNNGTGNDNSHRKLVFAFQLLPQSTQDVPCASEFSTLFVGPFFLWINTTTLATQNPSCTGCNPDLSTTQILPTSLFFAPGNTSVIGRIYVDHFTSGSSVFNYPMVPVNNGGNNGGNNGTNNGTDNGNQGRTIRNSAASTGLSFLLLALLLTILH